MALVLEIKTTSKKAAAEIKALANKAGASVRTLEKQSVSSAKQMTSGFKSFASVLGVGLGITAAIRGFKKIINAASDTVESLNKVREVFGEAAESIEVFSESAAENLGASRQEALEMTGEIGNLFVAFGFAQEEAANFSKEMVQLAADVGSFNNVTTTEALEAVTSAIVGMSRPMRRFGADTNQTRLDQIGLSLGLDFTKGKMDSQTRAITVMQAIMQDTAKAQGDFRRTSKDLANSQKILAANFEDLTDELGHKFLPAITAATNLVNDMVEAFSKTDFDQAIDKLKEMGDTKDFIEMLELNRALREEVKKRGGLVEKILDFQREQIIIQNRQTGETIKVGTALEKELDTIINITKFTRDTAKLQDFIKTIEEKRLSNQKQIAATLDAGLDKTTGLLDRQRSVELSLLNTSTSAAEFLSLLNEEKTITSAIKSLLDRQSETRIELTVSAQENLDVITAMVPAMRLGKFEVQKTAESFKEMGIELGLVGVNLGENTAEMIEVEQAFARLNPKIKLAGFATEEWARQTEEVKRQLFEAADILNEIALLATKKKKFSFSSLLSIGAGIASFIPGGQGVAAGLGVASRLTSGFQGGGSFIVPGTGSGDRPHVLNLEPGERVDVTPRNQVTNNKNITMQNTFIFQIADEITVKTKLIPIINDYVQRQGGKLIASGVT